jgi:hypothetical protein
VLKSVLVETDSSRHSQKQNEPRSLLYILFAFFGFFIGRSFSKLRSPENDAAYSRAPNSQPNEQNKRRADNLTPLAPKIPPTPPDTENACKCCHHKTPRWKVVLEVGMLLATAGAVIAAAIYASITHRMWTEMQQQTCIQRNAAMNAERAWVGLDGSPRVDVGLLENGKLGANIQFAVKDYGKGPALSVMAGADIVPSRADNPHIVEDMLQVNCNLIFPFIGLKPSAPVASSDDLTKHQWGHAVFPNQTYGTSVVTGIDLPSAIGKEAYIVGYIAYRDQFSEPHWTKFCYNTGDFAKDVVKDASSFKHLYLCNANNYTDEAENKQPSCPVAAK